MNDNNNPERRRVDDEWKQAVDGHIVALRTELANNTRLTKANGDKLEAHIKTTGEWRTEVQPVVEAMATMKSGIRVIGSIGSVFKWCVGVAASLASIWLAYKALSK